MSPMYLDYFVKTRRRFIYLFLMTILAMETTQENFYYSQDASLISLFRI